jgi:Na+-translocating ferredoxin:NAD+ oxidoreductase RnfD subunit
MYSQKKLIVSHAPFIHNGSRVPTRNYHILLAALPAVLVGLYQYGIPAVGVVALSVSSAILWELVINFLRKSEKTIGDGNAAVIGLIFAMLASGHGSLVVCNYRNILCRSSGAANIWWYREQSFQSCSSWRTYSVYWMERLF